VSEEATDQNHPGSAPRRPVAALVGFGLLGCSVAFSTLGSGGLAFVWFLVVFWAVVCAPGWTLVDRLRLPLRPLDAGLLACLLGILAAIGLYWVSGSLGTRPLFWAWPALAVWAWFRPREEPRFAFRECRWSHVGLVVVVLLAVVPMTIVPIFYANLAETADGGLTYQALPDVIFHTGVARELQHSIPPQVPFLPGVPLRYHCGADLLAALLAAAPGLGVSDVVVRFTPTLFVVLLAVAAFCFARTWLHSEAGAVAVALLVFFGEDLSYVPGWLTGSSEAWVIQFFGVPSIVSLYLLNPLLPALAFLFAGLTCLLHLGETDRPLPWGAAASVLFAGVFAFKVFAAAQLFASLAVVAVLHLAWRRDRRPLLVLVGAALLALPMAAPMLSAGSDRMWVRLDTWPWVPAAIVHSGLHETKLGRLSLAGFEGTGWLPALAYWALAVPAYLVGALGVRWIGLSEWLRELVRVRRDRVGQLTAAVFVGLGPLLTLSWVVTPAGYPALQTYNEAVWFFVQGKYLAWVFAVAACGALASRSRLGLGVALSVLLLAAAPSSVQYLAYQVRNTRPRALTAAQVAALGDLQRLSEPGDVVLADGALAGATVALTHCRARDLSIFAWVHVPREEFERQLREEQEFWTSWRQGVLRRDIVSSHGARFVLAEHGPSPPELRPVTVNGDVKLFEVGDLRPPH
jgi:hypothetical protein